MTKLSTREIYLRRAGKKRSAMIKGRDYHFSSKKSSLKFKNIIENNNLIIKQLRKES